MKFFLQLYLVFFFLNTAKASETIIFNTIEKSASVFIAHKLARGLNKSLMSISTADHRKYKLDYHGEGAGYILESRLKNSIPYCPIIREHLFPTPQNIALLKKYNLKMIFHVRDLRQRIVSLAHYHFDYISRKNPEVIASYEKAGYNPFTLTINDLIEINISRLPSIIKRIEGWLDVYKSGTIPILITTYEEFHDHEGLFFEKILDFYNIPKWKFVNAHVPKNWEYKFRKGSKNEWYNVLTLDQQRRINEQIPDELFDFFGWEN